MEDISTLLLGLGLFTLLAAALLGIAEFATVRTIRAPKRRTFTYLRLAETQYQGIVAPTLGALIAGLFVSISASFFYDGFTRTDEAWYQWAGAAALIAGVVVLLVTLKLAFNGVGEPTELARDPFTIRAAAEEFVADPRGDAIAPPILQDQLDAWASHIATRSLNILADVKSDRLERAVHHAMRSKGFIGSVWTSLRIYIAAVVSFPVRFGWPVVGLAMLAIGTVWFAFAEADFETPGPWPPIRASALLIGLGIMVALFYCAARGNRARLWHRINVTALADARSAVRVALAAEKAADSEDAQLQRVLDRADVFLQTNAVPLNEVIRLRFGRFRITITRE